jgi:hypothetical protein
MILDHPSLCPLTLKILLMEKTVEELPGATR